MVFQLCKIYGMFQYEFVTKIILVFDFYHLKKLIYQLYHIILPFQKTILSIIPYYFTTHPTFQFLFSYSTR